MKDKEKIVIVGAGIGGLMCAYRLANQTKAEITIIEKGRVLEERICPLQQHKVDRCIRCPSCAITNGVAGAGAFSDGKFIIGTAYGGWLPDFLGNEKTMLYINEVDRILQQFADHEYKRYLPDDKIKQQCMAHDLYLQQATVVHFGTDGNRLIMTGLVAALNKLGVKIITGVNVDDVDAKAQTITTSNQETISYDRLVIASGRSGAIWLADTCKKLGVNMRSNQVDIGVRVELPRIIWEDISRKIYEPKIIFRTKKYGDNCRMFCFNSGGEVVMENNDGIMTVNGHANADEAKKTVNSNFALLSTTNFTQPFDEPIRYAQHVARLGNMISGGSVLVQRLGDLRNGKRTDAKRLAQSTVIPTLKAVPGDLSLCIPQRQLENIVETLQALDQIAPGTANYDTLLYGVEAKYYSAKPEFMNEHFEIVKNIYALGDGSGVTRSLSQAGAMGLYVAEGIINE